MDDQPFTLSETSRVLGKEEDNEDFRSCCEDEEVWRENAELAKEELKDDSEKLLVKMFFKGISMAGIVDSGSGLTGIGVVMENLGEDQVIQVQKKLDFFEDEYVAEYLALMDGIIEAIKNKVSRLRAFTDSGWLYDQYLALMDEIIEAIKNKVSRLRAFTDSEWLYDQIMGDEKQEIPLLAALRERVVNHARNFEAFSLKLIPSVDLEKPLHLARVAIGIISFPAKGLPSSIENCSICCQDKPSPLIITLRCSHKFCSNCMKNYVNGKLQPSQVPIRCPQLRCKYRITPSECKSFLPLTSYESLEKVLEEAGVLYSENIYCPYPNCSVLLDARECLSTRASSSSHSENSCVDCPVCQRYICVQCGVPWHFSMSCEEYQNLPLEERDTSDTTMHHLAQNKRWKRCQQCQMMVELTEGCYHMRCWCGHEFCYSCGAEFRDGERTCQCLWWDEDLPSHSLQESEQWAWETLNSLSLLTDTYSDQERAQLALIQRFLAGGFGLSDHYPYQSPPRCTDSFADEVKDLHQLPWLERFVSVMSDNYYDEYIQ